MYSDIKEIQSDNK